MKLSKTITVKVTKTHIKNGKVMETEKCPVALALSSMSGEKKFSDVLVDYTNIQFTTPNLTELDAPTPLVVKRFLEKFDDGKEVYPFSFKLRIEQEV